MSTLSSIPNASLPQAFAPESLSADRHAEEHMAFSAHLASLTSDHQPPPAQPAPSPAQDAPASEQPATKQASDPAAKADKPQADRSASPREAREAQPAPRNAAQDTEHRITQRSDTTAKPDARESATAKAATGNQEAAVLRSAVQHVRHERLRPPRLRDESKQPARPCIRSRPKWSAYIPKLLSRRLKQPTSKLRWSTSQPGTAASRRPRPQSMRTCRRSTGAKLHKLKKLHPARRCVPRLP